MMIINEYVAYMIVAYMIVASIMYANRVGHERRNVLLYM